MDSLRRFAMATSLASLALGLACGGAGGGSSRPAAPVITTQPASVTVNPDSNASFTVAARGSAPLTIAWSRSNDAGATWNPISGATGLTFTLVSAQLPDSGALFRATATNAAGSATSQAATLTVGGLPAPAFTTDPTNAAVDPGSAVNFTVAAMGTPTPTITWERSSDGGATWTAIDGASGATYTFIAQLADNGAWFRAVATNPAGTALSRPATLAVPARATMVYAAGTVGDDPAGQPGYWLQGAWNPLPLPASAVRGLVCGLAVSGSTTYVAGMVTDAANTNRLGYWQGAAWHDLPVLDPTYRVGNQGIAGTVVSGGSLFIGGWLAGGGSVTTIPGYWQDGVWHGPAVPYSFSSSVSGIFVNGGDTYVFGGRRTGNAAPSFVPGYWQNGVWTALPLSGLNTRGEVGGLTVSGDQVYAAGTQTRPDGTTVAGFWRGSDWTELPGPDPAANATGTDLAVVAGEVLVSGTVTNSAGSRTSGYWRRGSFIPLTVPDSYVYGWNASGSMVCSGSDRYFAGFAPGTTGITQPGYWLNETFIPLQLPSSVTAGRAEAIVVVP